MITVNVDLSEARRVANALKVVGDTAKKGISEVLTEVAKDAATDMRADAPVRTGTFKGSIGVQGGADWRRVGSFGVRYAPFIEWGTYKDSPQPTVMPHGARAWAQLAGEVERLADEAIGEL